MRPRVTIAGLLGVIVLCGVAFASLRSPSQLWASLLFLAALGSIPLAAIHLMYNTPRGRAFWLGFLICGASYFAATLAPWFRDELGPRMATTAAIELLYAAIVPPAPNPTVASVNDVHGNIILQPVPSPYPAPAPATSAVPPPTNVPWTAGWFTPTVLPSGGRWDAWTQPDRSDGVGWQMGQLTLLSTAPFRRIGHALFTLLFAALGGAYARHRFDRAAARAA